VKLIVIRAFRPLRTSLRPGPDGCRPAVALVNPRQTRDFARSRNWLAKNDRIDARLLSEFAQGQQSAAQRKNLAKPGRTR